MSWRRREGWLAGDWGGRFWGLWGHHPWAAQKHSVSQALTAPGLVPVVPLLALASPTRIRAEPGPGCVVGHQVLRQG